MLPAATYNYKERPSSYPSLMGGSHAGQHSAREIVFFPALSAARRSLATASLRQKILENVAVQVGPAPRKAQKSAVKRWYSFDFDALARDVKQQKGVRRHWTDFTVTLFRGVKTVRQNGTQSCGGVASLFNVLRIHRVT